MTEYADEASLYAGGTELLLLMKLGLAEPGQLIDIKAIEELGGVAVLGDTLALGATATHAQLSVDPDIGEACPELSSLFASLANPRVRHAGTIGGNLCFADPHSDPLTLLIALGASVDLASAKGTRQVQVDQLVLGAYVTVRAEDEVLTSVRVPMTTHDDVVVFERMVAYHERPVANAALSIPEKGAAILALGALTERPVVRDDVRDILLSGREASWHVYAKELADNVDMLCPDGSQGYYRNLLAVMVLRVFRSAAARLDAVAKPG